MRLVRRRDRHHSRLSDHPHGRLQAKYAWGIRPQATTAAGGSLTELLKLIHFVRYASRQPEPLIAKADDDVWISPELLRAHVSVDAAPAAPISAPTAALLPTCDHRMTWCPACTGARAEQREESLRWRLQLVLLSPYQPGATGVGAHLAGRSQGRAGREA